MVHRSLGQRTVPDIEERYYISFHVRAFGLLQGVLEFLCDKFRRQAGQEYVVRDSGELERYSGRFIKAAVPATNNYNLS